MFTELGTTGLQRAGGQIFEEFLRQLQGTTLFTRAMKEMAENDPIVGAMLYAIEMLIRGVTWTVEAASDSHDDEAAAGFIDSVMNDMSHTWQDFISEWAGAAPVFGWAAFEVVYKKRLGDQLKPGLASRYADGMIGVRKLAIRHPDTLDKWEFDESDGGRVVAMIQRAAPDWKPRTIPIQKLLLFVMQSRKDNPMGRSLLRNAYTSYFRKKKLEQIEAIGIERNLAGLPVAWVPPQLLRADASNEDRQLISEIKKIVKNVRNDEQAGVIFPLMHDEHGNKTYDFTLLNAGAGKNSAETNKVIERYNRLIAMTILADVILIGHEKVGSFSLASSKTNLFAAGLGAMMDGIQEVLNRHLVPRLLRLNGFVVDRAPRFKHGDVESVDLAELGEFVGKISGAGAPIFPSTDGELEKALMRAANLPSDGVPSIPTVL